MISINQMLPSSISAGLGAMTFRNKLSRLQENLSNTAKVGIGGAAVGGGLYGLYHVGKKNENIVDKAKHLVGQGDTPFQTIKRGARVVGDNVKDSFKSVKDAVINRYTSQN